MNGATLIAAIVLVAVLIVNSELNRAERKEREAKTESLKQWKTTRDGVVYYETCIGGNVFYVVRDFKGMLPGLVNGCQE